MDEAKLIDNLISNTFTEDVNKLLQDAASCGYAGVVKILLDDSRVDPSADNNFAINVVTEYGHTEVVALLLKNPRVNPAARSNSAIVKAAQNDHDEIVKLLLADPRVDPSVNNNTVIISAAHNGRTKVVELLLKDPRVDPRVEANYCIRIASRNGHVGVVKLLLKDSRVDLMEVGNSVIICAALYERELVMITLLEFFKHKFNAAMFIETWRNVWNPIPLKFKHMMIGHIVKYQWHMNALFEQYLLLDLLPQISYFITAN